MGKNLTDDEIRVEKRKQNGIARLGSNRSCAVCGEDDWRCLELHHIAGQAFDEMTVTLCRNCHRKQSDPSNNKAMPSKPSTLEQIGQFLLGLAELLLALAEKIKEFGHLLLQGASQCPEPRGNSSVKANKYV